MQFSQCFSVEEIRYGGGGCNYLKTNNLQSCFFTFSGFLCRTFYCLSVDLLKFLCRTFHSFSTDLVRGFCCFSAPILTFFSRLFGSFRCFYIFKKASLLRALSLSVFRNLFFAFRYTGFALCISIFRVFHVVFRRPCIGLRAVRCFLPLSLLCHLAQLRWGREHRACCNRASRCIVCKLCTNTTQISEHICEYVRLPHK